MYKLQQHLEIWFRQSNPKPKSDKIKDFRFLKISSELFFYHFWTRFCQWSKSREHSIILALLAIRLGLTDQGDLQTIGRIGNSAFCLQLESLFVSSYFLWAWKTLFSGESVSRKQSLMLSEIILVLKTQHNFFTLTESKFLLNWNN